MFTKCTASSKRADAVEGGNQRTGFYIAAGTNFTPFN
jgi:hypothetical protein